MFESDAGFYTIWESFEQATWDITSMLIIFLAYFSLIFFLVSTIMGIPWWISILICVGVTASGIFMGFWMYLKSQQAVVGREILEVECTDKYGIYRFLGQNLIESPPTLLEEMNFAKFIQQTRLKNQKELEEEIKVLQAHQTTSSGKAVSTIQAQATTIEPKIIPPQQKVPEKPVTDFNITSTGGRHDVSRELNTISPEAKIEKGYTYQINFTQTKIMIIWLPVSWTECFKAERQAIMYKRVPTFGAVSHCWVREVSHEDNILRCYLRVSDLCTFETDIKKVRIDVESLFLDMKTQISRQEAQIIAEKSKTLGYRRTAIGLANSIPDMMVEVAEIVASAQGGTVGFVKNMKPRGRQIAESMKEHWWKWMLFGVLVLVAWFVTIAMLLSV